MEPIILVWAQLTGGDPLPNAEYEIETLEDLQRGGGITVRVYRDACWSELPDLIEYVQPSIFHFIGHGKRGYLAANDRNDDGFPGPVRITPQQISETLNYPGSPVKGIFLNGCDTAHWAPHLIPGDGWVIGSTRSMDDDYVSFFAGQFYPRLAAGETDASAFELSVKDMEGVQHPEGGRIVRWVVDPEPDEFLHKIFCRPALTYSTVDEGSLLDLATALEGVRQALTTQRLVMRDDLGNPRTVYCRERFDDDLIAHLKSRLTGVTADLRQIRKEFPEAVRWAGAVQSYDGDKRQRFITLADRLDTSRNALLAAANEHLPANRQLQEIPLSSKVLGPRV